MLIQNLINESVTKDKKQNNLLYTDFGDILLMVML